MNGFKMIGHRPDLHLLFCCSFIQPCADLLLIFCSLLKMLLHA